MKSLVVVMVVMLGLVASAVNADVVKETWGGVKVRYRGGDKLTQDDIQRAAAVFQQTEPSQSDIEWLESLDPEQRQQITRQGMKFRAVPELALMELRSSVTPLATSGSWDHEFIEKREGGGAGCYASGFWNDTGMCGLDFPLDKIYRFPCSNRAAQDRMRIWSTNWRVRWALGSGVDARVYDGYVDICFGYWSLYLTGTNPYTVLSTTYIYW